MVMLCDKCGKREASIFIRREGAGESALCDICAREQGISAEDGRLHISLEDLFSPPKDSSGRPGYRTTCAVCGTRLEEVRKTGRIGCPECFASFRTELLSYLKRRGRGGAYHGSVPRRFAAVRPRSAGASNVAESSELKDLEAKLKEALESEEYEKAALIRDRIRETGRAGT